METWGNKVKVALSRLGKTDNYLYTKPEQDWTQEDKALVISFLRKSKVAENTQMEDLQKIKEFFSQPIPGEDAIDTITMDVPLFLRMLEYAREDAQQDVDLHDVTQRAIELNKAKPFLSMEDYNEIAAAPQEIDEEVGYLSLKDDNPFDDIPSIDIQIIDDKEGASSPKAFVNFSSMYHSGDNGKMEILRNNPALQDKVMRMLQSEFQKTFRRVIHGVLGKPFGLNEDAFEDTWKLNQRKAKSFIEKYPNDPNVGFAKAYLAFDDIVKANKYWNDFDLKSITSDVESLTNMESLKEIVRATLLEKKKKRDRCLRIADRRYKKPSAYKSGAVVRCRDGEIWKDLKEVIYEIIQEDESLYKWFKRTGTPGKEGGWVDCNAPIRKDGKITGYKSCGRKKGEKRAKYPSCRPTAAKCKDPGKGKKWGKTK
jgi:hypothetical protein